MSETLMHETLLVMLGSFVFFFGGYMLFAAAGYQIFWVWGKERWLHKRIQPFPRRAPEVAREIKLSFVTMVMLAVTLGALYVLTEFGWTRIYYDIGEYGWGWFLASILVMALVHDSYYYWAHRWMHSKLLFKHVHRVHHEFTNPTPFASYAFHPLEGVIEIAIVFAMLFVLPIHPAAFATYLTILSFLNVISHLGYELYPASISKWFITATHHNFHHSRFVGHYMLYFNFWDKWMGSNYADYHQICEKLAAAKPGDAPLFAQARKAS